MRSGKTIFGETHMDLRKIPEELRNVFEDAGLMAEAKTNERIKNAMLGLQHALESDLKRVNATCACNDNGTASTKCAGGCQVM